MLREFAYRKAFRCSHEEYLNESADRVSWFLEIERIVNERGE